MNRFNSKQLISFTFFAFFCLNFKVLAHESLLLNPRAPRIQAKSYLLLDYHSGQMLEEYQSHLSLEPASLTKMMTIYVVDHAIKNNRLGLDDWVSISEKAWKMPGSRMFLQVGSRVKVRDLMKGIIIQSGNDASVALAEWVAGSEEAFVDLMNAHAKALHLKDTYFKNATGMPHPAHKTSAQDMASLARALIREFPKTYELYSEKQFKFNKISQSNRNKLLWQNTYVDGIKTGHTEKAGFCMVASGVKNDTRLIAVVMGTHSENQRALETNKLLNYGFRFFETYRLYPKAKSIKKIHIYMGTEPEIDLVPNDDVYVTIQKGQYSKLKAEIEVEPFVRAPIDKGQVLGQLKINLDGKMILECPLQANDVIPKAHIFRQIIDYLRLHFFNVLGYFK